MTATLLNKLRPVRLVLGLACLLGALSVLSWHLMTGARTLTAQTSGATNIRVDVELVTVEVTVLDSKGDPVRNLKKEDFRLFEDGKEQEISTFEEISEESEFAMPTSLADLDEDDVHRGKTVLLLFDDSHIRERETKITRDSAEQYVKQHMRPQDLFAVAAYGKSLKILQNYTHDGDKVIEAIRQPAAFTGVSLARQMSTGPGGTGSAGGLGGGASYSSQESNSDAINLLRSFGYLASSISRIKGRKIIILYGGEFSISVDIQNELQSMLMAAKKANVVFYTIDSKGLESSAGSPIGQLQNNPQSPSLKKSASQSLAMINSGFVRMTSIVSAFSPVSQSLMTNSFLAASGGGGAGGGTGGDAHGGAGGGAHGGTGGSAGGGASGGAGGGTGGGAGGSPGGSPGGAAPGGSTGTGSPSTGISSAGAMPGRMAMNAGIPNILRSMASETGGLAIFNTNNFNEVLDKVSQQLDNYYVLGFVSNNPKRDGKLRKLEVKTNLKRVSLKHRESYLDPRPIDVLAGSKGEKALAKALASSTTSDQLPLTFRATYFYDESGIARVPIEVSLQTTSIELKKKGGNLAGDLNVMGIAYAENGAVAARFSETVQLLFAKEKEEAFRKQRLTYENYFKLRPGKYLLKLAFADEKGRVGSMEKSLAIPALPTSGLAASSLVLIDRLDQLPELVKNIQSQLLDETNPFFYQGFQVTPSVENKLATDTPVRVFYKIYNLSAAQQEKKFVAKVSLTAESGEHQAFPELSIDDNVLSTGKTEAAVGLSFGFSKLAPGNYKLSIETLEIVSNQSVTVQTDLQVQ